LAEEKENPTKVQTGDATAAEESEAELMSLDNLDSVIAEADPEFAEALNDIGPNDGMGIFNEGVGLEYTLDDEMKLWQSADGKKKLLLKFFPFAPKLSFKMKMISTSMRLNRAKYRAKVIHFIKNIVPMTVGGIKKGLGKVKGVMTGGLAAFGTFSVKKKLAFVGLLIATFGAIFVVQKIVRQGLIHPEQGLFMASFADWAEQTYYYDATSEHGGMESFYDSLRTPQNMLALDKMIVNLRRSESSGANPMGAFEFIVEGAASDVVVEIKDREPEMRDLFQRTMEEMSFDQLATGEGKQLLCEKLRKAVNQVLTKGKVRRIFIKTAIVKP
jgi:Flagellar basal body-associated protein